MSYTSQYQNAELLVQKYIETKDPKAKENAIKSYLPLVKYIVGRINLPKENVLKREDLNQYGIVGLLDSIERYNPEVGVTFKTFAYKRIHGEIVDAIRKSGVLSRSQVSKITNLLNSTEVLKNKIGRNPLLSELCEYMDISLAELHKIQGSMSMSFTLSLDEKIGKDNEELTLNDIGQVLNISESRVSQIMNKTLMTLQRKLKD